METPIHFFPIKEPFGGLHNIDIFLKVFGIEDLIFLNKLYCMVFPKVTVKHFKDSKVYIIDFVWLHFLWGYIQQIRNTNDGKRCFINIREQTLFGRAGVKIQEAPIDTIFRFQTDQIIQCFY